MIKVLFVCLGNICRSPVAEAIFKKSVIEEGLDDRFFADSAGTSAYHLGEPPDRRSVSNARDNGVEVIHNARQFTVSDFTTFDYILAMDHQNLRNIRSLANSAAIDHSGIFLFRSFQDESHDLEVPDPYFGGPQGFQKVFDILRHCNIKFIEYLKQQH